MEKKKKKEWSEMEDSYLVYCVTDLSKNYIFVGEALDRTSADCKGRFKVIKKQYGELVTTQGIKFITKETKSPLSFMEFEQMAEDFANKEFTNRPLNSNPVDWQSETMEYKRKYKSALSAQTKAESGLMILERAVNRYGDERKLLDDSINEHRNTILKQDIKIIKQDAEIIKLLKQVAHLSSLVNPED